MKYLIPLLAFLLIAPTLTRAEDVGIVAVVNGKAITNMALQNRLKLIIQTSNLEDSAETRRRFARQVLENLIDETLQQEEAKAANVSVSQDDMMRAVDDLEQRNQMPKGSFENSLASRGISTTEAMDQIRAKLLWQKLVIKKIRPRISVGTRELDEARDQIARKQSRREYQLSEIVLPVLDNARRDEIRALAERIVSEVKKGADFGVLARQFSVSGTALQGGDTGWIPAEKLEPEAVPALAQTPTGSVTAPIPSAIGYKIYRVNKRYDPQDTEIDIKQIYLPTTNLPEETKQELRAIFEEAARTDEPFTCGNFLEAGQKIKSELKDNMADTLAVLDLGRLRLTDLSAEIRDEAAVLPVGEASPVIVKPNGITLLMVCDRAATASNAPDDEKIRDLLTREKVELEARRYLMQIRKSAFIERRM